MGTLRWSIFTLANSWSWCSPFVEKSDGRPRLAYDKVHRTITGSLNEVPGIIVHEAHKGVAVDGKDLIPYINGPGQLCSTPCGWQSTLGYRCICGNLKSTLLDRCMGGFSPHYCDSIVTVSHSAIGHHERVLLHKHFAKQNGSATNSLPAKKNVGPIMSLVIGHWYVIKELMQHSIFHNTHMKQY